MNIFTLYIRNMTPEQLANLQAAARRNERLRVLKTMPGVTAWKGPFYREIRASANNTLNNYLKNKPGNAHLKSEFIRWKNELKSMFTGKNLPKYLYRGVNVKNTKNIRTYSTWSSWTTNRNIASGFSNGGYILQLNTNLIKNIPFINLRNVNEEREVILAPFRLNFNASKLNGRFLPVTSVAKTARQ